MRAINLIGGPLDGARAEAKDGRPDAAPGSIIHVPSGHADGMVHTYEVRKSDPCRADYLGDGYFGLGPAEGDGE
jgi:hypothetical protein